MVVERTVEIDEELDNYADEVGIDISALLEESLKRDKEMREQEIQSISEDDHVTFDELSEIIERLVVAKWQMERRFR